MAPAAPEHQLLSGGKFIAQAVRGAGGERIKENGAAAAARKKVRGSPRCPLYVFLKRGKSFVTFGALDGGP